MSISQSRRSRLVKKYLRHNLALLPIAPPQRDRIYTGKAPLTSNGYKGASNSRGKIDEFFKTHPNANVAVATGSVSKLVVFDVDPRHGGAETLARLERQLGPLPSTWQSRTSRGGVHLYFRWPSGLKLTRDSSGKIFGVG